MQTDLLGAAQLRLGIAVNPDNVWLAEVGGHIMAATVLRPANDAPADNIHGVHQEFNSYSDGAYRESDPASGRGLGDSLFSCA